MRCKIFQKFPKENWDQFRENYRNGFQSDLTIKNTQRPVPKGNRCGGSGVPDAGTSSFTSGTQINNPPLDVLAVVACGSGAGLWISRDSAINWRLPFLKTGHDPDMVWQKKKKLQPDPNRFPQGIRNPSDYVRNLQ